MCELICPKCGKVFYRITRYNYAYKDEKGCYCSWTCYNHRNDKPPKSKKSKKVELLSLNGTPLKEFTSATNAAEYTGFDIKRVQRACREQSAYMGYLWRYKNDLP